MIQQTIETALYIDKEILFFYEKYEFD